MRIREGIKLGGKKEGGRQRGREGGCGGGGKDLIVSRFDDRDTERCAIDIEAT